MCVCVWRGEQPEEIEKGGLAQWLEGWRTGRKSVGERVLGVCGVRSETTV